MAEYYETNMQYILDELKRIDLLIHLEVQRIREIDAVMDGFQGLYVSDEEINSILDPDHAPPPGDGDDQSTRILKGLIAETESEIARKREKSRKRGIMLNLPMLAEIYGLTPFETDTILISTAPELDTKYEQLYAYLRNDATKKQPGVDLILRLLCNTTEDAIHARRYFHAEAQLFKNRMIRLVEEPGDDGKSLLSRSVKADDRITDHILGFNRIDATITPFTRLIQPRRDLDGVMLTEELKSRVRGITRRWKETGARMTCLLQGPYGAGKKTVSEKICGELGVSLLIVDIRALIDGEAGFGDSVSRIFREAVLQDSAVYLEHFEELFSEDAKNVVHRNIIFKALEEYGGIAFIASVEEPKLGAELQKDLFKIEILIPDYAMRKTIWDGCLNGRFGETAASVLANKFKFSAGQINDAITSAEKLAVLEEREEMTIADLYSGCRAQSNQGLTALARRIKPKYGWDDIILPKEKAEQLKEVTNYVKNRGVVYYDWGFDDKLSLGKGLNVLFSGPSGTGKTMAAEVIASELRLDLYKIDLSMIVSKYIGETEKNLNRIFKEAEESNAILFFDEADALFGKRSEVQDSHDRYANIEISYLLQKMEENDGIVILASNLSQNIDDAFLRRMHFTVEFPFPEEEYRYKIWKSLFPVEAPLSDDIDYEFLAKRFKLAGGNIKNIVVNAAFLAAENSGVIAMEEVIHAAKREFQKIGKVCSQSEFGKYYGMICKE
ncbi:MAG: AAA family ATPase [Methanosarcinales archaeon]|nr:AAA family ATPase [Methanosarcinales archaeon]